MTDVVTIVRGGIPGSNGESFFSGVRRLGSIGSISVAPDTSDTGIINSLLSATVSTVVPYRDQAAASATAAALSASDAQAASRLYPDTTTGLAAVVEGQYFSVPGTGNTYATTYRKVSGAAVAGNSYPSKTAFDSLTAQVGTTYWLSNTGSDSNTGLSPSQAFLTYVKAKSLVKPGDIIRGPGFICTENFPSTVTETKVNYIVEGSAGNPIIFNCYTALPPGSGWTNTSGTMWQRTLTFDVGSITAQRYLPNLLCDTTRMTEIRVSGSGDTTAYANAAAARAGVAATPGTFFLDGSGNGVVGGYNQGFPTGTNNSYVLYVNAPDGAAPSTHLWSWATREAPKFGDGCTLRDAVVFGGTNRDGTVGPRGLMERVRLFQPAGHCHIGWAKTVDVEVDGGNPTVACYAFHSYTPLASPKMTRVHHLRPRIYNWAGVNTMFGTHGALDGNPAHTTVGLIEIDDLVCENVGGLGTFSDIDDGVVIRNPVFRNIKTILGSCNVRIYNPVIYGNQAAATDALFTPPGAAANSLIIDGGVVATNGLLIRNLAAGSGKLTLRKMRIVCGSDSSNGRWADMSLSHAGLTIDRCVIEGDASGDATLATFLGTGTPGPITITDSALGGLAVPAAGTGVTITNTALGRTGLIRGVGIDPVEASRHSAGRDLGEVTISMTCVTTNVGSAMRKPILLTNLGIRAFDYSNNILFATPGGVTFNAARYVGDSTNKYILAVGNGGVLYKGVPPYATGNWTAVTTGRTTNWNAVVTSEDGNAWLLGSVGEITYYAPATDTFADITSGVTYPLLGGHRQGNTILVWGTDITTGGVLVSTNANLNASSTFGASLTTGDSTPASIGTFANRILTGGYVNGVYFLAGHTGTFLTSTTGATGTWASMATGANFGAYDMNYLGCAIDTTRNRILFRGERTQLATYSLTAAPSPATAVVLVDASAGTTVTNWKNALIDPPLPSVGAVTFSPFGLLVNNTAAPSFYMAGKTARVLYGEEITAMKLIPFRRTIVNDIYNDTIIINSLLRSVS